MYDTSGDNKYLFEFAHSNLAKYKFWKNLQLQLDPNDRLRPIQRDIFFFKSAQIQDCLSLSWYVPRRLGLAVFDLGQDHHFFIEAYFDSYEELDQF